MNMAQHPHKRSWRSAFRLVLLAALMITWRGQPADAAPQPTSWHVDPAGTDADDCGSASKPCRRINTAVRKAAPHDTILLAGGIYTETLAITKTLTLESTEPRLTVIDANQADSVIRIMSITTALTITGVTLQNGQAPYGGGIDNFSGGTVHLSGTTVAHNTATQAAGGGIFNYGTMTLINSTISDNTGTIGGGIATSFGTLTVTSSTISRNMARSDDERGGGGIFAGNAGAILQNTILAGNRAGAGADCGGTIVSRGYNLIGNAANCVIQPATGDAIGTAADPIDPLLGPLESYGGPTPTLPLRLDSPAIDAGSPAAPGSGGSACPATDQRGIIRPKLAGAPGEARCDIGAFEYDAPIVLPWLYLPRLQL